jgi:hypothetical protein
MRVMIGPFRGCFPPHQFLSRAIGKRRSDGGLMLSVMI